MGSPVDDPEAEECEKPQHPVTVSTSFYLAVNPVTQGQYRAVTGQSPSKFGGSDGLPVEGVSWYAAIGFCNTLSRKEELPEFYEIRSVGRSRRVYVRDWNGTGYRLPTEAEWEYACRAGSETRYPFGDERMLGEHAWYEKNSRRKPTQLVSRRRMSSGCTICWAMSRNGAGTLMTPSFILVHRRATLAVPVPLRQWVGFFAVGAGVAAAGSAARRAGNGTAPDGWTYYLGFRVARRWFEK